MPRIVRFYAFGGPEVLKIEDAPSQLTFMNGHHFSGHRFVPPTLPSRIGYEVSGVVEAVGAGVDHSWIGKRVAPVAPFDQNRYGTLGEDAIVPGDILYEYPPTLTPAQAASFWVPYLTAYGALVPIAQVEQGDHVSVPAASSAVGLAAIQIIRDAGATSIAVTRTSAKKDELLCLGADHVIVTQGQDYESRIVDITRGKGVRITFDPVGGPFLEQLAAASAPGGIVVEYGRLSGQPAPFPLVSVVGKGLTLRGYTVSEIVRDAQAIEAAKKYIGDRLADGRFVPRIARTFNLDQTVEAYRYLESDQKVGRVVITIA
jgi:NADPH:quinone reductase-like Zn-dependent oxidoreductase